jgi:hypothetical protein
LKMAEPIHNTLSQMVGLIPLLSGENNTKLNQSQ